MTRVDNTDADLALRPASLLVPASLAEALDALAADGSVALGGGVRHTLDHHDRVHAPVERFVAVAGLDELSSIEWTEHEVVIGAGVRLSRVAADTRLAAAWPVVTESAGLVATGRIRRMVTLGGNIAARDEKHDPPVGLAAAGATMTVRSSRSTRTLAVVDAGDLRPDEIIQDFRIAMPSERTGSAYEKFLVRGTWEYACVSVGAVVELDGAAAVSRMLLAVGSVAGAPVMIDVDSLRGADFDTLIAEAARRAAASTVPRSDVRGSAEYKTQMIAEFSRRAIRKAIERASALPEAEMASEGRLQ
jgi:aerobic carbon-monoxide dehydrogenase medium subunit